MSEWLNTLAAQWASQSLLEIIAVVLALAYVALATRQHIACWPAALVSTALYIWIFWEVSLPFQVVLNAYYLVMAVYGWRAWRKAPKRQDVKHKPLQWHALWCVVLTGVSLGLGELASHWFNGQYNHLDAAITVFSVFTTVLVAHKVIESWLYWVVIDLAAAYLYGVTGLYLTSVLFFIYTVVAIYGYWRWRKDHADTNAVLVEGEALE
ncbi:nicotinamide riboside transporter PnuC [Aestuariibacter halophilus]|uniref:Nicotinamide riboside transporter PnuC n=1 Tax=Fluctibacter halophilus TaxID=226011 RepID=A0ABS8G988_9ALTE|nr:nicotinamide riboside transporter PnuC [Aestuariibacter halophilus]MCC2616686.1 nicotinamide riboside transporter PnuC [Aestuariibacter halophilus]